MEAAVQSGGSPSSVQRLGSREPPRLHAPMWTCTIRIQATFYVQYFPFCKYNIVLISFSMHLVRPAPSHYFPSLHHLKFEVEDGTTPNARPVRFGYDPQEFPDFSWRGYAVMSPAQVCVHIFTAVPRCISCIVVILLTNDRTATSITSWLLFSVSSESHCDCSAFASSPIHTCFKHTTFYCIKGLIWDLQTNTISLQPEVILTLTLGFPGPFHIVMRYSTPRRKGRARVRARILVADEAGSQSCCDCK